MRYCFIGENELVTAFRLVGIDGIAAQTADEVRAAFRRITGAWVEEAGAVLPDAAGEYGDCKILILTEDGADSLGDELIEWQMSARYPLVVEVPSLSGHREGRPTLVDTIREAIGIQV